MNLISAKDSSDTGDALRADADALYGDADATETPLLGTGQAIVQGMLSDDGAEAGKGLRAEGKGLGEPAETAGKETTAEGAGEGTGEDVAGEGTSEETAKPSGPLTWTTQKRPDGVTRKSFSDDSVETFDLQSNYVWRGGDGTELKLDAGGGATLRVGGKVLTLDGSGELGTDTGDGATGFGGFVDGEPSVEADGSVTVRGENGALETRDRAGNYGYRDGEGNTVEVSVDGSFVHEKADGSAVWRTADGRIGRTTPPDIDHPDGFSVLEGDAEHGAKVLGDVPLGGEFEGFRTLALVDALIEEKMLDLATVATIARAIESADPW